MKKIVKKAAAVSCALLASLYMASCSDDGGSSGDTTQTKLEVTAAGSGDYVAEGTKAYLKATEKDAEIYYQIVKKGETPEKTITKDNYAEFEKYSKGISVDENITIYAVAVKDGVASEPSTLVFNIPEVPEDSDHTKLHDMILPSGTKGLSIPAWTVAAEGVKDLPAVVTSFTDASDKHKALNGQTNRTKALLDAIDKANEEDFFNGKEVKNVIFVFADGWGESHILGSRQYYNDGVLVVDHLPYHAPVNHDSYQKSYSGDAQEKATWTYNKDKKQWTANFYNSETNNTFTTTDSTAGGSAINTGFTTYYNACDVDKNGTEVRSIFDLAREKGMLVANVTNDWLTDATPATVGVHSPKRKDSVVINGRMYLNSPDWTMGNGGFKDYIGKPDLFKNFQSHEQAATNPGHLEQWFTAEKDTLAGWAKLLLKEYDGINVADGYDFITNWTTDRKLKQYTVLETALKGIDSDSTIRPLVSFNKEHTFKYDPDGFKSGKYAVAPKLGYKLGYGQKDGETGFPNYAEMVASTLYVMDKKAKAQDRGFFAFIENTCPDGWGHATRQYDCLNEMQMTDEGIAVAVKYVLENPDTLLVVSADHETGGIQYESGWETNYKKIYSRAGGNHSSQPVPVFAFGAGAKEQWGDSPAFDVTKWTYDEQAAFVLGSIYPPANSWGAADSKEATESPSKGGSYPKILRNRTTGIRIGKALGFDKFGDLNGNGVLDPETESDSVVDYTKVGTKKD